MELIAKTRLKRSAAEAAAFWEQAFHDNAAWKALVRWYRRPQLTPQISYHMYDRQIPEPAIFDISFFPISLTQCIMHITDLHDGLALSRYSVGYLANMRCESVCIEFQTLIVAKESPQIAPVDADSGAVRKLCQEWAARDILTVSMAQFLTENEEKVGRYYSVDEFKARLRSAGRLGLIRKVRNRWRPVL